MNGPIAYAWVLSPMFEQNGVGSAKARFVWTGSVWRLSYISCYDMNGRFMSSRPSSDYMGMTSRRLSEACMDIYGVPYSEQWKQVLMREELPLIQLGPRPAR